MCDLIPIGIAINSYTENRLAMDYIGYSYYELRDALGSIILQRYNKGEARRQSGSLAKPQANTSHLAWLKLRR